MFDVIVFVYKALLAIALDDDRTENWRDHFYKRSYNRYELYI